MKVAWFAEDLNNDKKVCNYVSQVLNVNLESLSSDVFERRTSTGSGLVTLLSRDFEHIFFNPLSLNSVQNQSSPYNYPYTVKR